MMSLREKDDWCLLVYVRKPAQENPSVENLVMISMRRLDFGLFSCEKNTLYLVMVIDEESHLHLLLF